MAAFSLQYIYHDCFLLKTFPEGDGGKGTTIVFDYWKDPLSSGGDKDFPPLLDEIEPDKPLYVVVSHHHKDHFSRRIFLWTQRFPKIQYIISHDTYKAVKYMLREGGNYEGHKPPFSSVHVLKPDEIYDDGNVRIKAFGSTDIGNSYAVESDGLKTFHAGDLNAWVWLDESSPEEVKRARDTFAALVDRIKEEFPELDLVMFPVDSRIGREYWWGAYHFVRQIMTKVFVPMHFELVFSEEEKEQRRLDAARFSLFARKDYGTYLQLVSTRSQYLSCY